jgi:hypothetical protein
MIRLTGRGSPAEDTKKVRPAMPVNGVCPPGLSQSKPQTPRAERRRYSAVRGDLSARVVKLIHHTRLRASLKPGVPRALGSFRGWNAT